MQDEKEFRLRVEITTAIVLALLVKEQLELKQKPLCDCDDCIAEREWMDEEDEE